MGRWTMCRKTSTSYAPALQTERLSLRPLTRADENTLHRISNDPLVRRYLWDDQAVCVEAIRDLVHRSMQTFSDGCVGLFGIRLKGHEDLVGFCGFVRLKGMDELELAYELVPELWGSGLATEAARACVRYAFEVAGLRRVIAGADPPNVASLRVLEKLGMKPVGNINPIAPEEPYYALYERGR